MKNLQTTKDNKNKGKKLLQIADEVTNLKNSPLYSYRTDNHYNPVIGQGNHNAKVMFIGEAPGKNEAEQGRPFCGASGKTLDKLLDSIKLPREKVYITNILKDRPQGNRDPSSEEIKIYAPFLDRQIFIIKPSVLATLGRFSMEYVFRQYGLESQLDKISNLHGKIFEANLSLGQKITIIPLYHPAVAIYNRNKIDELKKDFSILKKFI